MCWLYQLLPASKCCSCIASTYLAKNIEALDIKEKIIIDIDSDLHISTCSCHENTCTCLPFCTPIRGHFDAQYGFTRKELLNDIKQRKGEAEMSQVDWLIGWFSVQLRCPQGMPVPVLCHQVILMLSFFIYSQSLIYGLGMKEGFSKIQFM